MQPFYLDIYRDRESGGWVTLCASTKFEIAKGS